MGHSSVEGNREVLDVWANQTLSWGCGLVLLALDEVAEVVLRDGPLEKLLLVVEASCLFGVKEGAFLQVEHILI